MTITVEPTAWLRGALAKVVLAVDPSGDGPPILHPLIGCGPRGSRDARTCDRCRTYLVDGLPLHMFMVQATRRLIVGGGLCTDCAVREIGPERALREPTIWWLTNPAFASPTGRN